MDIEYLKKLLMRHYTIPVMVKNYYLDMFH